MKLARNVLLFLLLLILLPCVAWPQESSLAKDPVFRAARKAQQEGRLADAEKILNDRIHEIEQSEANSPQLVPYLNLLAQISNIKRQGSDVHAIYQRVLEIDRAAFGPGDGRSVRDLINVAVTLGSGKNEEEERLLKQALDLALQSPKPAPAMVAEALAHLAQLYQIEQRWYDAELLAAQGLKICASVSLLPGPCESLQRTLAEVYRDEGRTVDASQVDASNMDADFPPELDALNKSAQQYEKDGLYVQAEFTYRQAAAYIDAHPMWNGGKIPANLTGMLSMEYDGIGRALEKQGRKELAEESFKKAIASQEAQAPESPMAVGSFNFSGLMDLYRQQGRLNELEPIIQHAIELQEKFVGESSNNVAHTLVTFAELYKQESKYAQAKPLYERAMKIEELNFGPNNQRSISTLSSYADLLLKLHEGAKAAELQTHIQEIEKKQAQH
jgi:tetratricopeptide (TPR) repeat protein